MMEKFTRYKKMEDFTALSLTCKYLNVDCRDLTYSKLKKQKHAAHMTTYRLKKRIAILELTNKLLTACFINLTFENKILFNQILEFNNKLRDLD